MIEDARKSLLNDSQKFYIRIASSPKSSSLINLNPIYPLTLSYTLTSSVRNLHGCLFQQEPSPVCWTYKLNCKHRGKGGIKSACNYQFNEAFHFIGLRTLSSKAFTQCKYNRALNFTIISDSLGPFSSTYTRRNKLNKLLKKKGEKE